MINYKEKIIMLHELSAVVRRVGEQINDTFINRFVTEIIDGHIFNLEKEKAKNE